jgi:GTP-binding protein
VGKSTLINELIGEEKVVVSETPHTTRDSIRARLEYKSRKIELIDTAGLNTPNIAENDEEYLRKVQISTMAHVQESHVVVYVMDAFSAMVLDDFALIRSVLKEGRPVIIAVNKWEAIKEEFRYKAKNFLVKQIEKQLGELHGNPLVYVSAKMGMGLSELLDRVFGCYDKWNTRISTGMLNDWLENFKKLQDLPKQREHSLKINYMIQARVRPPHFIIFLNARDLFESHYERFLLRNLANEFKMDGVPLRLTLRSTNNKENKRAKRTTRKQSEMSEKME